MMAMPMPPSPQNSSSCAMQVDRPLASLYVLARNSKPYSPILAASWMIGHGVSSRSSHSAAAGRTTSSAKPCTQSRRSRWSSVRSRENSTIASGLRDVEQVTDLGGQPEVALGLDLAGHEQHHRVGVAGDHLEEVDAADGERELRVVLGGRRERAGTV